MELLQSFITLIVKDALRKGDMIFLNTSFSDLKLLKKIKKQDMNAVLDWFETRQSKFYKIGWAHLKNHHDVEDVVHNTVMIVHDKIGQLKEDKYFETWVTTIFINECRSVYRKRRRESENRPPAFENIQEAETVVEVLDLLDQLEEIHKEVVILKYIQGFSQKEIAQLLELPLGTVKSRLYRGLRTLRKIIEGGDGNEL